MRNSKTDKEKNLRKLWMEYRDTWNKRKDRGQYVDVEPYQSGWIRYYVPRQDIKNRTDIRYIKQALDLINSVVRSGREDFTYKNTKGVYKPISQKLKSISEKKWESLSPNVKKLFVYREYRNEWTKKTYFAYGFKFEWYFEFEVEPCIITQQWLPDSDWETYVAELNHRIERNNLWPQINKMLGVSSNHREWKLPLHVKNKRGMLFVLDDIEHEMAEIEE